MSDDLVKLKFSFGPWEIEGALFEFLRRFTSSLSILLYGAQGTGKTSFAGALSGEPVERLRNLSKTTAITPGKINYAHSSSGKPFRLSGWCIDFPGNKIAEKYNFDLISKNPPLVTLLFLDHYDTRKKQHKDFENNPNPTEIQIREWEVQNLSTIGRADRERISENRTAIRTLYGGFCRYSPLKERCCLIVPIMAKRDLWGKFHTKDYFYDQYQSDLEKFPKNLDMHITNIMPCSTILNVGNDIYNIMRLIDEETRTRRNLLAKFKQALSRK